MKIRVCVPSYKRPSVKTLNYLPFARVYVCETEAEKYRKANPDSDIVTCAKGIQGNLCRIRNHILDSEFSDGVDVVCLMDDDYDGMYYYEREPDSLYGYDEHLIGADYFLWFIERYSILCSDFGFYMWGVNVNYDPMSYEHFRPFNTTAYIGGPFSCHLTGSMCRYDETLPLKEDYDMTLQHLHKYRGALRVNKYHYRCKQSKQAGGCASYRSMDKEKEQFKLLRQKWGADVVRQDRTSKYRFDYNPIIKSPIKGV